MSVSQNLSISESYYLSISESQYTSVSIYQCLNISEYIRILAYQDADKKELISEMDLNAKLKP